MIIQTKILTGAQIILETLYQNGVDKIFGYPGGIVLKLYDELYLQDRIEHILVRHEQYAVHAAEGYARATGKVGVVLVTSGPGATNTITGINNAYMDGFPLVVLTGQVNSDLIGKNAFQEANICDITKSCTKKVYQVTDVNDIQKVLTEAFYVAQTGKKGPVVVDFAKNILYDEAQLKEYTNKKEQYSDKISDIESIIEELNMSERPLVVAGGGAVGAYDEIRQFVNITDIPIVTTMMGTGVIEPENKNYLGMVGIFGDNSANEVLRDADLILSVGARFNDRITCCFDKDTCKLIQIDINEDEISNNVKAYKSFVCDAKNLFQQLIFFAKPVTTNWDYKLLRNLNKTVTKQTNRLYSFEVMQELNKFIETKDLYVTTEVGQHQLWAVKNLKFNKPLRFLTSGGSGTMGFGLPAAIGVAVADKSKPVICISGDGSFQMNMQELATCVDYNLPVKILIINNGYLGMVRQLQENQCEKRYSQTKISNPDFEKIAQAYNIGYYKAISRNDISLFLQKAFNEQGPSIIECIVEPMELV